MFQLLDSTSYNHIDDSIAYFESIFTILYDNERFERGHLKIEKFPNFLKIF